MSRPVAAKLLIKPGATVWVSPPERRELLGELPDDVSIAPAMTEASVAVIIVEDAAAVHAFLAAHATDLASPTVLWLAYPKGGRSDIARDTLWPMLAVHGVRPITQVAIDDTWSALRFRPLRDDEPPFSGGQ